MDVVKFKPNNDLANASEIIDIIGYADSDLLKEILNIKATPSEIHHALELVKNDDCSLSKDILKNSRIKKIYLLLKSREY